MIIFVLMKLKNNIKCFYGVVTETVVLLYSQMKTYYLFHIEKQPQPSFNFFITHMEETG